MHTLLSKAHCFKLWGNVSSSHTSVCQFSTTFLGHSGSRLSKICPSLKKQFPVSLTKSKGVQNHIRHIISPAAQSLLKCILPAEFAQQTSNRGHSDILSAPRSTSADFFLCDEAQALWNYWQSLMKAEPEKLSLRWESHAKRCVMSITASWSC